MKLTNFERRIFVVAFFLTLLVISLASCSSYRLSTLNHEPTEVVYLNIPSTVKIDTLTYRQLNWKMRTDFTFRWNFAQYAKNQPYTWYMSNYTFNMWRPYNSFDVYWNRDAFWNHWAFGVPSWNYWNYNNYGWFGFNNYREVSYVSGRRGSTMTTQDRRGIAAMIETSKRKKVTVRNTNWNNNSKPIVNSNNNIRVYQNPNNPIINKPPTINYNNAGRSSVNATKPVSKGPPRKRD